MAQSAAFGMQLRIGAEHRDCRAFVAMHLLMIFIVGAVSVPAIEFTERGGDRLPDAVEFLLGPMPIIGIMATLCGVGVMLFAAATVGLLHSFREERNLLPGAMQMAAYLTPYLVLWLLFGVFCAMMVMALENAMYFAVLEDLSGVDADACALTLLLLPNLMWLVGYFVLVSRGTLSTRYANR